MAMLAASRVRASGYPTRPIRFIVPGGIGGTSDLLARILALPLGELLGQPVYVDNRSGAGSVIGTAAAASSPADGYTLLLVYDVFAVVNHLYRSASFDAINSFDYLTQLVSTPQLVITSPKFAPNSIEELIRLARARPLRVSFGSSGVGGSNHLYPTLFADMTGIELQHVPYRVGGTLLTDLAAGTVDIMFSSMPTVLPRVRAGQFKALAVTSAQRVQQLPQLPTVSETVPGFTATSWFGVVLPKGTPKEVLAKLRDGFRLALDKPIVKSQLDGFTLVANSQDEFRNLVQSESVRLGALIRAKHITVE